MDLNIDIVVSRSCTEFFHRDFQRLFKYFNEFFIRREEIVSLVGFYKSFNSIF
jgi:hypothetical protein